MNFKAIHKFQFIMISNYFLMLVIKVQLNHLKVFLIHEKKKKELLFYNGEDPIIFNYLFFQKYL